MAMAAMAMAMVAMEAIVAMKVMVGMEAILMIMGMEVMVAPKATWHSHMPHDTATWQPHGSHMATAFRSLLTIKEINSNAIPGCMMVTFFHCLSFTECALSKTH